MLTALIIITMLTVVCLYIWQLVYNLCKNKDDERREEVDSDYSSGALKDSVFDDKAKFTRRDLMKSLLPKYNPLRKILEDSEKNKAIFMLPESISVKIMNVKREFGEWYIPIEVFNISENSRMFRIEEIALRWGKKEVFAKSNIPSEALDAGSGSIYHESIESKEFKAPDMITIKILCGKKNYTLTQNQKTNSQIQEDVTPKVSDEELKDTPKEN